MKRIAWMLAAVGAVLTTQACGKKDGGAKSSAAAPAKVDNRVKESDLTKITLTAEAVKRLGVELVEAVKAEVAAQASVAGEVAPIPGRALMVNAPVAGTLSLVRGSLAAGELVQKGEAVYRLTPLAGVQRDLKVTVEADVKTTKARLETATLQLARAQQLLRELAGSQRQVEAAEQEFGQAKAANDAAIERLRQVQTRPLDADVQMTVTAPANGIVRQVLVAPGQTVASGAALFEVVDYSRVWLRVPIYAGEADSFHSLQQVRVQSVDGEGPARTATRAAAPPTADPLAVTSDLYFELSNADGRLRPGQRLMVHLPTQSKGRSGVMVPTAAVLYDVQGGTWVYVNETGYVYRRQRVELIETQEGKAYLGRGLNAGTRVVTAGAAELFGTEFGAGK